MRAAQGNRPGGASAQRISDWKAGRNVPARFESLLPVVLTLVELARKAGSPLSRQLAEPKEWQRLWHAATTWVPEADAESACPYLGLTSYRAENHRLFFGRADATAELAALVRETAGAGIVIVVGASGAGKSSLLAAGLVPTLSGWEASSFTPGAHPLAELGSFEPRADGVPRLLIVDQFEELFTTCDDERERTEFLATLHRYATRAEDPVTVVVALRADFYAHCLNYRTLQDSLEHRSFLLGPMRLDELAQAVSGPARAAGLELEPGLEELVITELCGAGEHHDQRSYDPGALPLLSHVMAATWQHREGRRLTVVGYRKAGGVTGSVAETAEQAWLELSGGQQKAAARMLLGLVAVGQDSLDTRRSGTRSDLLRRAADQEDAGAALELLVRTRLITLDAESVTLTHEIVLRAWPRLRGWIEEDRVGYLVRQRLDVDAAEWAAQERDSSLLYRGTRLRNALDHAGPAPIDPLARDFLAESTATRARTRRRSSRTRTVLGLLGVVLLILGFAAYTQTQLARKQLDDKNFAAILATADRIQSSDPSLAAQLYLVAQRLRPASAEVQSRILQTQNMTLVRTTPLGGDGIWDMTYRPDGVLATVDTYNKLQLWDVSTPRLPRRLSALADEVTGVEFSIDRSLMATGYGADIRLWDIREPTAPRELGRLQTSAPQGAAQMTFIGDGRTLAVLTTVSFTLWDLSDPTAPVAGSPHQLFDDTPTEDGPVILGRIDADPTGNLLAISANRDSDSLIEAIQLWDVSNRTAPVKLIDRLITTDVTLGDVAFAPGGTLLAIGTNATSVLPMGNTNGTVELWDLTEPNRPRQTRAPLETGSGDAPTLAFTADGNTLAVGSGPSLNLWNMTDPAYPVPVMGESTIGAGICHVITTSYDCAGSARDLAFTSDGRNLFSHRTSGDLLIWSLPPSVLTGHAGYLTPPLFDASGDRMVTMSTDGRIIVWDMRNRRQPARVGTYRMPPDFYSTALSPDGGTLLVSSSEPMKTFVLDLSDASRIRLLGQWPLPQDDSSPPYPSGDWRIMAKIHEDETVRLWDLSERTRPVSLTTLDIDTEPMWVATDFQNRTLTVQQLANEPGGAHTLLVTSWDVEDPAHPVKLADAVRFPTDVPNTRAYATPDPRVLVVVSDEALQSWDVGDPAHPRALGDPFTAHTSAVNSLGFTTDGHTMLTAGSDGTLQLWDYTDPTQPRPKADLTAGHGKNYWSAAVHPAGGIAIGASSGGALRLWNFDRQHAAERICAITGDAWTEKLWQRYLPQISYDPPCD
ncbi:hypothetical protein JK358_11805 [Nocardia sp. 2]|uniref:Novel STAND NTPase 1 domain-containing protein n=1 Tax=Nocardia acididurans TaxID=2802282 RepID=A0ABS1M333_9NOCA|nr:WD40 repeat domain-containing protein [Nocardia acididurans]MBL1075078.1 hypothetical protein [Nocardia acididurans]